MTANSHATRHSSGDSGRDPPEQPTSEALVNWLSECRTYPECATDVRRIETHISWVFLSDRYAYKLKKPVQYEFLDFSTAELRHDACEAEVRLNRRMAPDVYLGVVPITITAHGGLQLDGTGKVVDWLVKMRRLPEDRTLDCLIRDHQLKDLDLDEVTSTLVAFYSQLPPITLCSDDYRRQIEEHVQANFVELSDSRHGLSMPSVERVHGAQLKFLRSMPSVLDCRVCDGHIVEGHGDLRPEHIYLVSPPVIIDCIEFSADYRRLDVADELAFLAMECDALGAEGVGERTLDAYCRATDDDVPPELWAFYRCYRACVRAKIMSLRARQCKNWGAGNMRQAAQEYLELADRYAREMGPPLLLVVRGLMGTGKSTLAGTLADLLGAVLLQTDSIRQQLFGVSSHPAAYGEGHYRSEDRARVYDELFHRAGQSLADGRSVVLDGTFLTAGSRQRAIALSNQSGAQLLVVECRCPEDVAISRIAKRLATRQSESEARPDLIRRQREEEEPDPPGIQVYRIETTESPTVLANIVLEQLCRGKPNAKGVQSATTRRVTRAR